MDQRSSIITVAAAPIHLTISRSILPSQEPEILELLHLRQGLPSNLERASHPFPITMASDLEELILISAASVNSPSAYCRSWLEGASRTTWVGIKHLKVYIQLIFVLYPIRLSLSPFLKIREKPVAIVFHFTIMCFFVLAQIKS
ncbi:hypothetical protein ATANTOWER_016985 [Ataeniobius toweri]|uniref:Uncharacterized protein n=1 Tax=Ataeniobius toweri TaxID=208326 RepID=A0ABU7A7E9_9TELE|nr:hypothetical protein [Ataeniobius toweri]